MIRLEGVNDTNKIGEPEKKEQEILRLFLEYGSMQSSDVYARLRENGNDLALVTVKRTLHDMVEHGFLHSEGAGRSVSYTVSVMGRLCADIDASEYCSVEPDKRYGKEKYEHNLLSSVPVEIFTDTQLVMLDGASQEYRNKTQDISEGLQKKELERLVIELAWKSSKIEGNTYTLLDTERLIREQVLAEGHSKEEAQMILNHKDAFSYIYTHTRAYKTLTRANLEDVHALLVHELGVERGLREKVVGVVGSKYQPLETKYQIEEAVASLGDAVERMVSPYSKALLALLGVSYVQPFEDGNKRTARFMANALLMAHRCAPLSYRSVEVESYREAMLVFYELNSLVPFRSIFIDQYLFATQHYSVTV